MGILKILREVEDVVTDEIANFVGQIKAKQQENAMGKKKEPIIKICEYCGSESDDGSKYCSSCGAPLKSKKKVTGEE